MQKSSDPFENWAEKAHDLPSIEAISALIGAIYDCALDPGLWDATLVDLKEMFRCQNVVLGMTDPASGNTTLTKSVGIDPYWLERFPLDAAEVASWPGSSPGRRCNKSPTRLGSPGPPRARISTTSSSRPA